MTDTVMTKVTDLVVGDRVDLADDPFADPKSDHPSFEFEYAIVDGIELETPNCVRVDFEGSPSVGFPPEHQLKVRERL